MLVPPYPNNIPTPPTKNLSNGVACNEYSASLLALRLPIGIVPSKNAPNVLYAFDDIKPISANSFNASSRATSSADISLPGIV